MARILVGFDGSPPSRRALQHAARRAAGASEVEIVLLTVVPASVRKSSLSAMMPAGIELPRSMSQTFEETARMRLDEVVAELGRQGVKVRGDVRAGDAAQTLLAFADELRADEIVIGHKSFEGPRFTLGPNADEILRHAKVPVTVVP